MLTAFTYRHDSEKDGDAIQAEGVMTFCEDLGVDPSDVVTVSQNYLSHR